MAKFKVKGRIVSGKELVKIANREFTRDPKGKSVSGRPRNINMAYNFLRSGSNIEKYKVQEWNSERRLWM